MGNAGAWGRSDADPVAKTQGLSPPSYKTLGLGKPLLQGNSLGVKLGGASSHFRDGSWGFSQGRRSQLPRH